MNVAQVSFHADFQQRRPEALIDAWPTMTEVASAAAGEGCRVTVIQAAHHTLNMERNGVRYCFLRVSLGLLEASGTRWLGGFREVVSAVAAASPDVIHLQGLIAPVHTRLLARAFPAVAFLAQDHANRPAKGVRRPLYRWGFSRLDGVAFTARDQAKAFVDSGVLSRNAAVFEVVEGSSRFTPGDCGAARAATGLSGDPCVVWVGRLDENKDPLTVLDGIHEAASELPNLRLWCIYSSAPLLGAISNRLSASPALARRVRLLGEVPHHRVQDFLRAADLFVLASRSEGSGYSLIEALACGATPVVTDIPSFRKLTGNGLAGGLFPAGDAREMARLIVEWSRGVRPVLRQQARRHFESALSYEAIGRQLRQAYNGLLSRS